MNNQFVKKALLFCGIIFLCSRSAAQNTTGTWEGNLHVQGNEIPIVFHIGKDSTGKLVASFDSPSQHALNLPVSEVIQKQDSLILMMAILKGKFAGHLTSGYKQMNGLWYQGGGSLPLEMSKTSEVSGLKEQKRPQTPLAPYAYHSGDVIYYNADKTIQYGGTITYPEGSADKQYPAVILITGSGQQDRDETIFGHKPFAVIAYFLTKKGFVVLRTDDRGIGKTTGNFSQSTTLDFAKDVEASLDFLEKQPQVDKGKIGLIGHSEGGMIAPMVAGERNEIKFIVLLAGPGIPIIDLMQMQTEAVAVSEGKTSAAANADGVMMHTVWEEVLKNQDSVHTVQNIRNKLRAWINTLDSGTRATIKPKDTSLVNQQISQAVVALKSPWYQYFIAFNPQPFLQKLTCKVLALNGSKDVQVIASPNLAGIESALKKSKSPGYDTIQLAGLNHLFQTCVRCSPSEYSELEETFSPRALQVMGEWLQKNVADGKFKKTVN
jgi:alpha/beta superfamily hydrolase